LCYILVIRISFHFDGPGAQMAEMESTTTATQNWSNLSVKSTEASATIARSADARNARDVAKFSPDVRSQNLAFWVVRGDEQRAIDSSGTLSAIAALVLRLGAKLGVQPLLIVQQIKSALDESMPWLDFNWEVLVYVAAPRGTAADEGLDALGCLVSVNCSSATRARTKEALLHP